MKDGAPRVHHLFKLGVFYVSKWSLGFFSSSVKNAVWILSGIVLLSRLLLAI